MRDGITIYFIRHGETDWNAERRYQGQRDIAMNAHGRAQAERNGRALRACLPGIAAFDYVASPLGRTVETMRTIRTLLDLPPGDFATDPALVEVNYGRWEGQLASHLHETHAAGFAERARDPFHFRPPDGESYADLMVRTDRWLDGIRRDTVVVSHGGVSRTLRGRVLSLPEQEIPALEMPQDRVLVLRRGFCDWL